MHGQIGEVGERIAQGRQFPVQHGADIGSVRGEHGIIDAVIAMDDGNALLLRHGAGQVFDQLFHFRHMIGFRGAVLLGPAADLAGKEIPRPPVIAQADGLMVDSVELGQGGDEIAIHRRARLGRLVGQETVGERAALDHFHDVEHGADDAVVLAQGMGPRHRETGRVQGGNETVFAIHGMGRRQDRTEGFAPQHIVGGPGLQAIGGIGLATGEFAQGDRTGKSVNPGRQPGFQLAHIDLVSL